MELYICSHKDYCKEKNCPHKNPHKWRKYCDKMWCLDLGRVAECIPYKNSIEEAFDKLMEDL